MEPDVEGFENIRNAFVCELEEERLFLCCEQSNIALWKQGKYPKRQYTCRA